MSEQDKSAGATPGPWLLIRQCGKDGSAIATQEPAPETMLEPNYWTVASVNTQRDEWRANARLIAAAPDLLEALKECVVALAHAQDSLAIRINPPTLENARAAIKNATEGKQEAIAS
jgi:hypothetical protein